jgi:hypothetical protein
VAAFLSHPTLKDMLHDNPLARPTPLQIADALGQSDVRAAAQQLRVPAWPIVEGKPRVETLQISRRRSSTGDDMSSQTGSLQLGRTNSF